MDRDDMTAEIADTREWYTPEFHTPAKYVEAARDVLGAIDLDPASSDAAQKTIRAGDYFTKHDDGLVQEWHGRVWLCPPFTRPHLSHFVRKLLDELAAARVTEAILLTHNSTDTEWFHLAAHACAALCFTRGRVKFYDANTDTVTAPTQGQAFFYFGARGTAFADRFRSIGCMLVPAPGPRAGCIFVPWREPGAA